MSSFIKYATFALVLHAVFFVAMNLVYVEDPTSASGPNEYVTLGHSTDMWRAEPDLFSIWIAEDTTHLVRGLQENWTIYSTINQTKVAIPNKVGGEGVGTNVISFLDPLNIVYGIQGGLNTLLNIGVGPLAIVGSDKIDPIIQILIGLMYSVIVFLSILAFIRGVSD